MGLCVCVCACAWGVGIACVRARLCVAWATNVLHERTAAKQLEGPHGGARQCARPYGTTHAVEVAKEPGQHVARAEGHVHAHVHVKSIDWPPALAAQLLHKPGKLVWAGRGQLRPSCACVRACVCVCACVCVRACECVCVCARTYLGQWEPRMQGPVPQVA